MENEVKEPAPKYNFISPEQYLEMERAADTKHEYYKGEVFAMSGASRKHNIIVKNINTVVLPFLKGKPCDMFGSDLRIHIPENSLYTYPDFSIICGKGCHFKIRLPRYLNYSLFTSKHYRITDR